MIFLDRFNVFGVDVKRPKFGGGKLSISKFCSCSCCCFCFDCNRLSILDIEIELFIGVKDTSDLLWNDERDDVLDDWFILFAVAFDITPPFLPIGCCFFVCIWVF